MTYPPTSTETMTTQNHLILFLFLLLSSYTFTSSATLEEDNAFGHPIDRKLLGLDRGETLSHFRFYLQEIIGGTNPNSITIVPPIPKYNTTTFFGSVRVMDIALTVGPNLSSRVVGRAESITAATSQSEFDLLMIQNFVFYEGRYNGSTITILGRNAIPNKVREMPIVGGSGVFRFSKGYAEVRAITSDLTSSNITIQYDVYVYHH